MVVLGRTNTLESHLLTVPASKVFSLWRICHCIADSGRYRESAKPSPEDSGFEASTSFTAWPGSSDQSSRVSSGQDALQRAQLAQAEAQKCRESNEALKAEVAQMRASLDKVAVEANGKIDAANERIRTLRKERDDALKEGDRLRAGGERLLSRQEECRRERQDLAEQKEALLKIVEDLHQPGAQL
eukprot:s378_g21.t1